MPPRKPKRIKVKLRKNGIYWQARWTDSKGRRRGRSLGRVGEEESLLSLQVAVAKIEDEVNRGDPMIQRSDPTMKYVVDEWLALKQARLAPRTYRSYIGITELMLSVVGASVKIRTVTPEDIVRYVNRLMKDYKNNTANLHYRTCKGIFERARRMKFIDDNPFDLVDPPPNNVKIEHPYVSVKDLLRIINTEHSVRHRCYFATLRLSGMRRNEPLRMKWEHIDFANRRLIVPGNTDGTVTGKKRRRVIPLVATLQPYLLDLYERTEPGKDPFEGVCVSAVNDRLLRLCDYAGYKDRLTPQSLRVSCENDWMQRFPQAEVAAWLGHAVVTQMRYYHNALTPASQRTMDEAVGAQSGTDSGTNTEQSEKNIAQNHN